MTSSQPMDSPELRWTRATFDVPKMDCPSEERMVRLALADVDGVDSLEFDLPSSFTRRDRCGAPRRVDAEPGSRPGHRNHHCRHRPYRRCPYPPFTRGLPWASDSVSDGWRVRTKWGTLQRSKHLPARP